MKKKLIITSETVAIVIFIVFPHFFMNFHKKSVKQKGSWGWANQKREWQVVKFRAFRHKKVYSFFILIIVSFRSLRSFYTETSPKYVHNALRMCHNLCCLFGSPRRVTAITHNLSLLSQITNHLRFVLAENERNATAAPLSEWLRNGDDLPSYTF